MKRTFRFGRTSPDFLMDELTDALRKDAWFEFNCLFLKVYEKLRERKVTGGGQEMLRLRMYDKLQTLVQRGIVEKNGKSYRGITSALAVMAERAAAQHCKEFLNVVRRPTEGASES